MAKTPWLVLCSIFLLHATAISQTFPLIREVKLNGAEEVVIEYTFTSDTAKGFFMITETFSQNLKLVSKKSDYPVKIDKKGLLMSGDQVQAGKKATLIFKRSHQQIEILGTLQFENYPNVAKKQDFPVMVIDAPVRDKGQPAITKKDSINVIETKRVYTSELDTTIHYRIQLAASKKPMDIQKLEKLAGVQLAVTEDFIDGYYKYTIGHFVSISEAQQLLNRLPVDQFKKPFIVAYQGKRRITIQKAMHKNN